MAEKVTIEIEAHFTEKGLDGIVQKAAQADKSINNLKKSIDNAGKSKGTSRPFDGIEKSATKAEKAIAKTKTAVDKLGKTKADVQVGVKDKATRTLEKIRRSTNFKANHILSIMAKDSATPVINRTGGLLKSLSNKAHNVLIYAKDHASEIIGKIKGGLQTIAGKTWHAIISAKDNVSGVLNSITNKLFSIKTLIGGIMGGMAFNQFALKPLGLADTLEQSFIGFETMFKSASQASSMMDEIKEFARTTPFKTEGVISAVQQMLRSGAWDRSTVMEGITKIGNAAAAAGQGTEGVQGIVMALQQMSMSGRVNAQDMMQLTNRGVAGWQMLADYYGKSLAEVRKMSEEGEISAEDGIKAIMKGMEAYDGMMDKMATRTASGIWSNIQDTFDLSIVEKWGKGLQSGAIKGLSSFAGWLDKISPMLDRAGASLEKIGEYISTNVFDTLEKGWTRIEDILNSDDFIYADGIGAKMKVLFGGIWDSFKQMLVDKAPDMGDFLGRTFSKGITGIADFISGALGGEKSGVDSVAAQIGKSFWDSFVNAFDGEKVKSAVWNAIKSIFSSAGKLLPGGKSADLGSVLSAFMIGKTLSATGIGGMLLHGGGLLAKSLGKKALGSFSMIEGMGADLFTNVPSGVSLAQAFPSAAYTGTGLMGLMGKAGIALGSGATSAGGLMLAGGGAIAGGIAGGASLIKGLSDLSKATKAFNAGNKTEGFAKSISGGTTLGGIGAGAAAGAAIGSVVPVLGTAIGALIGAGVGGVAGWVGGNKLSNNYRASKGQLADTEDAAKFAEQYGMNLEKATFATEEMREAIKNTKLSAADLGDTFERAVSKDMVNRFGKVSLSLSNIDEMAKRITFGDNLADVEQFTSAVTTAQQTLSSFANAKHEVDKWNLKASVGLEVEGAENIDQYKADIESFMHYAKGYVEDKHYEFTAAVSVLLDPKSEAGKGILDSGNAFYKKIQNQLNDLNTQIDAKIKVASADGVITLDEQAEIQNLTDQVNNIINSVAQAESNAKLDLIQLQFGSGNMTSQNFADFQNAIAEYVQSASETYGDAYVKAKASIDLQLERGEISQEEYNKQLQAIVDGYNLQISTMKAQVNNVQLEIMSNSYADLFNGEAEKCKAALEQALQQALSSGIDPIEWDTQTLADALGLDGLSEEAAAQLKTLLSNIFNNQPTTEVDLPVDVNTTLEDGTTTDNTTKPEVTDTTADQNVKVDKNLQDGEMKGETTPPELPAVSTTQDVNVTPNYKPMTTDDILALGKGPLNPDLFKPSAALNTTADVTLTPHYEVVQGTETPQIPDPPQPTDPKTVDVSVNTNYTTGEVGQYTAPQPTPAPTTANVPVDTTYTTGKKSRYTAPTPDVKNVAKDVGVDVTYIDGNIGSYTAPTPKVSNVSVSVGVDVSYYTASKGSYTAPSAGSSSNKGRKATGGFVSGKQLSWLAEEGHPEAVIPFNPARRGRAIDLWTETGRRLGVLNNAAGGIVGDNSNSSSPPKTDIQIGSSGNGSSQGIAVKFDKGAIQINITADSSQTVSEAIEEQKEAIANEVAGIFSKVLGAQFANMPVRVTT